jgi:hypothetical protein
LGEADMMRALRENVFWRMKLKIGLLTLATFIAMC